MFSTLYIEEQIADHPRTRDICARFPQATQVRCERYAETGSMISYPQALENEMTGFCTRELLKHVPETLLFPCRLAA